MSKRDEHVSAMLVQKHQLDQSENKISELDSILNSLHQSQESQNSDLDSALSDLDDLINSSDVDDSQTSNIDISIELLALEQAVSSTPSNPSLPLVSRLDMLEFKEGMSWSDYQHSIEEYASRNNVDLNADPFQTLMTVTQRIELEKRIKNDFTLKNAQCDKYDYLLSVSAGLIGGLVDVFLVGAPSEGKLTEFADGAVNKGVEKFAKLQGWSGGKEGSDSTKSAIGFLERKFRVNYDQATTLGKNGTDGAVKNLSPKNHHLKSLGHSPDPIGLFFSVLNQFTNTSTFISNGQIITIDSESFELHGSNFVAKIFCGIVNWLGHLFSDMAGSSGASGRGAGIPMPLYNFLLLFDFGEFGQHRQSFATVATKVFEEGYDFRHGIALSIPVLITELLTRFMWSCKQKFYHKRPWRECVPSQSNQELRRMLLVAHGSLCLIDAVDAGLRSGGDMVQFLLRSNLIAWVRFGSLGLKEVYAWHNAGHIDADAVDSYLDAEYAKILHA